jgi:ethanolamine utilization microcompartment shell protein EutS
VATGDGDDRDTYCLGSGPPVLVDDTCTGDVAAAVFRAAVCACGDLGLAAAVTLDGFDSRTGPWAPGGAGGDLASNRGVDTNAALTVGGSVTATSLAAGPRADIAGDLALAADLGRGSSTISVGGSARIGGDVAVGALDVRGTLTTSAASVVTGAVTAGTRATGPVAVPPPCPCDAASALDVAAVIALHATANHDAAIGLQPDALAAASGDQTLTLPCGRYYLAGVQIDGGGLRVRAEGRVALFIAGNVTIDGDLTVEVAPDAELDLFVGGALNLPGLVTLGDPARPRALRVYVASAGTLALSGGSTIAGNLYAPAADLASSAAVEIFGAVLVNHWNLSAPAAVHYDRAIATAGDSCEP